MVAYLKNRIGEHYPLITNTEVTEQLSADGSVTFSIDENEYTKEYIDKIGLMWKVLSVAGEDDLNEYVVIMLERNSSGKAKTVNVTCRESHIHDLLRRRIYDNLTGSFTAKSYFDIVFKNSGYNYELKNKVSSSRWENAGDGDTRLEMFKNGLKRYGLEYEYDPKTRTFYLYAFLQRKVDYYLSSDVNVSNVSIEEDGSEIYTYIRGYGDFEENSKFQEGGLQIIFDHPMSNAIGVHEAPPLIDGKYKNEDSMKRELEARIAASQKISLTIDFVALRTEYSEAVPKIGDIVTVKDTNLGINDEVRIIEVNTKRNSKGNIIEQTVVLGDYKNRERYMKAINNAASFVNNVSGGSKSITTMKEKVENTTKATRSAIDFVNGMNANGRGVFAKSGSNVLSFENDATLKYSSDDGNTSTTLISGNGLNTEVVPSATTTQKGMMSSSDKNKLDQLNPEKQITDDERLKISQLKTNDKGLIISDGKSEFNLIVVNGKIEVKPV